MYKIKVAKFGGRSLVDYDRMIECAKIVENQSAVKVVVCSACAQMTNLLERLSHGSLSSDERSAVINNVRDHHFEIYNRLTSPSEVLLHELEQLLSALEIDAELASESATAQLTDKILSYGELFSSKLFSSLLQQHGIRAQYFDVCQIMVTTDTYGQAKPLLEDIHNLAQEKLCPLIHHDVVIVTQGYIGNDARGNPTTLGREGSDFSAAIIAEAIEADRLDIWTDVRGIFTADPKLVNDAQLIKRMSFPEAAEMAYLGAKVLHPATLYPAIRKDITVFVGDSSAPDEGGTIVNKGTEDLAKFRSLVMRQQQTLITIKHPKQANYAAFLTEVYSILQLHNVPIDFVTSSDKRLSFVLNFDQSPHGPQTLSADALQDLNKIGVVSTEQGLALIAVTGSNLTDSREYLSQLFLVIDQVNVRMVSLGASPNNISILVDEQDAIDTLHKLHDHLFHQKS